MARLLGPCLRVIAATGSIVSHCSSIAERPYVDIAENCLLAERPASSAPGTTPTHHVATTAVSPDRAVPSTTPTQVPPLCIFNVIRLSYAMSIVQPFNLGDASPESPSSLSMRSLGRPAEAGIRPFAQYASLSGLGAGPREGVGDDVQAFASGPGNQGFLQTQGQHPGLHPVMSQFISDQVAPWNPLRANADPIIYGDPGRQSGSSSSFGQSFPNFSGYRSAAPPSEADTAVSRSIGGILSDSGYGSMARQSVGNPSVCGGDLDQSMETQSLIMRFQWAMVARGSMASEEELQKREQVGRKPAPANPGSGKLTCPQCNTRVKTNSELK